MRIAPDIKKSKMQSGKQTLKEASEKAPRTTGYFTLLVNDEKVYIAVAEEGLREEFIKLYNGFHIEGDTDTKIYENRSDIIADWMEEHSLDKAREVVEEAKKAEKFSWM